MLNLASLNEIDFGKDFLWGTATAAHQVEGNDIHSSNWYGELRNHYAEPSGMACNFWELYPDDIKLMKELGYQAFRMSVGWGRLEPEEGHFDDQALAVYLDMFAKLKENGIKIFLTLLHSGEPEWFAQKGGFSKPENIGCFLKFAERLIPEIADFIDFWMVSNEFNLQSDPAIKTNILTVQAQTASLIRRYSKNPVSSAHALLCFVPDDPNSEADRVLSQYNMWKSNGYFFHACRTGEVILPGMDMVEIPELKESMDFWGINYYTRIMCSAKKKDGHAPFYPYERLQMIRTEGFYLEGFYPDGLRNGLLGLKDKPIYITENGNCCDDDRWRILKLGLDLTAMKDAMDHGADIRGYLHWSFMDNYEWNSFLPRFGLIHVDFDTFKRTPKKSAYFLRDIIAAGGKFDGALIRKYIPELPQLKLY